MCKCPEVFYFSVCIWVWPLVIGAGGRAATGFDKQVWDLSLCLGCAKAHSRTGLRAQAQSVPEGGESCWIPFPLRLVLGPDPAVPSRTGQTEPIAPSPAASAAQLPQGHRRQRCQAQGCSRLAPCSPRASIPGSKSMLLPVCLRLRESVPVTALASSGRWRSKDESLVRSLVYFLLLLDMGGTKWSDMRRFLLEILITFKLSGLSIIHLPFFGFKPLAVLFLLIVWGVLGL